MEQARYKPNVQQESVRVDEKGTNRMKISEQIAYCFRNIFSSSIRGGGPAWPFVWVIEEG